MKEDIRILFAENLKKLRKKRGLTQDKLSELTEIDYKYVQRLEGKNPPAIKIDTIQRIATVLKIKPSKFLED